MDARFCFVLFLLPLSYALPDWSQAEPLRTIDIHAGDDLHSAIKALQPGDRLIAHEGTYSTSAWYVIQLNGTQEHPIRIEGAEGESVTITRPDARQNNINIDNSEYLAIRNIRFLGGDTGVKIGTANNLLIEGCEVLNTNGVGIAANSGNTHHLYLLRNHIHHTGGHGEGYYLGGNYGSVVMHSSVIEGNYIHDTTKNNLNSDNQGDGIEIKQGSWGNLVKDNAIFDVKYPGIIVYGTAGNSSNIIEGNVIIGSGDNCIQAQGEAIIRNNIVSDCAGWGIYSSDHQGVSAGLKIISNTVVGEGVRIKQFRQQGRDGTCQQCHI
jgi:hypothetical protein